MDILGNLKNKLSISSHDTSGIRFERYKEGKLPSRLEYTLDQSEGRRQRNAVHRKFNLSFRSLGHFFSEGATFVVHDMCRPKGLEISFVLLGCDCNNVGVSSEFQELHGVLPRSRSRSVDEDRAIAVGSVLGRPITGQGKTQLVEEGEKGGRKVVGVCDRLLERQRIRDLQTDLR